MPENDAPAAHSGRSRLARLPHRLGPACERCAPGHVPGRGDRARHGRRDQRRFPAGRAGRPPGRAQSLKGDPMSNERPEFPPIESAPPRHTWVWALAGAALVIGLIWIARRAPDPSPARPPAALAAIADAKPAVPAEAAKPPPAAAKGPESPNGPG